MTDTRFSFAMRESNGISEFDTHQTRTIRIDTPTCLLLMRALGYHPSLSDSRHHHWFAEVRFDDGSVKFARPVTLTISPWGDALVTWVPGAMGRLLDRALNSLIPEEMITQIPLRA